MRRTKSDIEAERRMDAEACDALLIQQARERGLPSYQELVDAAGPYGHGEDTVQRSLSRLTALGKLKHAVVDGLPVYEAVRP